MRLSQLARMVKSNNAGATYLTFDIVFEDLQGLNRVRASGALSPAAVAGLYRIPPGDVRIFAFEPTFTIKITIPRPFPSGGVEERDFDGVQQFAPLLDLEIGDAV